MPAADVAPVIHTGSPYPGLRPFEPHESFLFHGRETHTQELLGRLANHRFLAVVGSSGSGKSSLVRGGLLPALYRGFLTGAGSRWRIAVMRPGSAPLDSLAEALSKPDVLAKDTATLRRTLDLSSFGLLEAVRQAKLEPSETLLVVVDQFEELFRFDRDRAGDGGAEAQLFVASLLEASSAFSPAVYVVLTMRSDFLGGDCAQFSGLPEALNQSQYLIPRLTREQRREAIEKPLALVGARMTPSLVQRLLHELGDDPDQLPVLQHALNRTWQQWKDDGETGDIEYKHYEKAGTLQGALNDHADGLMEGLPEAVVGKVFRCLTTVFDGRKIRRPASLDRVLAVAGEGNEAGVRTVAERYADPANSLLVLSPPGKLKGQTMIDIAHESLIRRWGRLDKWVDDEADCVRWYADAVEDVRRLGSGKVKTWRDPKLGYAQGLLAGVWNEAWAAWSLKDCPVAFRAVKEFLHQSVSDQTAEEAQKEAERQAKLEAERQAKEAALAAAEAQRLRADAERSRKKWLAAGLALALGLAAAMGFAAWSYRQAQQTQEELVSKTKDADAARKQVAIAEAELRETNERRAEVERLLNDNSGRSQADRKRLEDELKQLSDKSSSDKKSMLAAEARLKMESEALAQLRQQATAKDKEYAQAVERAARLERDLKSAQEEIEKLKGRPVPADPKTGEELRQAKLRIEALEKEVRELRAEAVKPAVAIGGRKAGETRVHSDGLTYVWIPPGKFRMGCSPDDSQCDADEKPAHDVTITSGFWISETEVTRQAWRRVVGTDPSSFSGDDRPVEGVSWDEATRYCGAIGGRLPTEAEWEYAARAGATTATYGPLKDVAWYSSNSRRQTPYAATRKPNAWGLYDTLGNVSEWVADWYGPFTDATISDPVGPAKGNSRVVRGGSWSNNPGVVRVSFRSRFVPSVRFSYIGFRCAGEFR